MNSLIALRKIDLLNRDYFETSDISALLNISPVAASQLLLRLASHGHVIKLIRGKWAKSSLVDPHVCAEFLTFPSPSYISLHSAMYLQGMISQIPKTITLVSTARTKVVNSNIGNYSIYHIEPDLLWGYSQEGKTKIKVAYPEKALFDYLYLKPTKSKFSKELPEIELPKKINMQIFQEALNAIKSKAKVSYIRRELQKFGIKV